MYASSKGDLELVQLLLSHNADVNQKDLVKLLILISF